MIKKILFLGFFLSNVLVINAQNFSKSIDSLKILSKTTSNVESKIDAYIELGKIYNRSHVDSAMVYFKKAILFSEKNNLIAQQTKSYSSLATSYIIKGK